MANRIMDEIRESFRRGSILTKLIYINLGVFLLVKIAYVFFFLLVPNSAFGNKEQLFYEDYLSYLMVSSNLEILLHRVWTPFTYMFLHFGFLHILFNLLVLFWFGRIYLQYLTPKQLLTTYILGGLSGAALFLIFFNVFPGLAFDVPMLGASASIMAIVIAISVYHPNYEVLMPFIGMVKIKHIAIVYVVLDVLQIAGDNSGGHIAHLGGAFYGYLFAMQMRRGKDLGKGFSAFSDSLVSMFSRKSRLKVTHKSQARSMTDYAYNKSKSETQKEVDKILEKIAKTGYDSLTKKEKELLFKMSDKK